VKAYLINYSVFIPWVALFIVNPNLSIFRLLFFWGFSFLSFYFITKRSIKYTIGIGISFLFMFLWVYYEKKFKVSISLSLADSFFENIFLLRDDYSDFLFTIPWGFFLIPILSFAAFISLQLKNLKVAFLSYVLLFLICILANAHDFSSKQMEVTRRKEIETNAHNFPYIGKLSKKTNVVVFLLEGVSDQSLDRNWSKSFHPNQPVWSIQNFFIPIPHSSMSILTYLTARIQTDRSRPDLSRIKKEDTIPGTFTSWGYQTAFISSQPFYIENIDQIANEFFQIKQDKNSLKEKYPNRYSEFSWGIDDLVLYDFVNEELLESEKPLFLLLGFSNTHSPYFLSDQSEFSQEKNLSSYERYQKALKYNLIIIDKIIGTLQSNRGKDTLFVLVSDHGESFGERGYFHHNYSMFNSETKVPCYFLYSKANIHYTFQIGTSVDFKESLLSLFETRSASNFFKEGYEALMPMKAWNVDSSLALLKGSYKWIYFPDSKKMIRTNLNESEEKEIVTPSEKYKILKEYETIENSLR
jgi:glucan phosphoethanolaminetransferase (alkaline phosphatase superfamily)